MIVVGCDDFSRNVADALGFRYMNFERRVFSDKELCPRLPDFDGSEVLLINRTRGDPNACIIETYLMLKTLADQGTKVFLFLPYMPYARQETAFRKGEPFSAKYIMEMLGIPEKIFTVTSHYQRAEKVIEGPVKLYNINGFVPLAEHLKGMIIENPLIVAPDKEIEPLSRFVASELSADHATVKKKRDLGTGEIRTEGRIPADGRNVVIVDDIVSTGFTMLNAAKIAKDSGAQKIICACVHPILADNAEKSILGIANSFIGTNTIDSAVSVVQIEKYAAQEIRNALQL